MAIRVAVEAVPERLAEPVGLGIQIGVDEGPAPHLPNRQLGVPEPRLTRVRHRCERVAPTISPQRHLILAEGPNDKQPRRVEPGQQVLEEIQRTGVCPLQIVEY